MTGVPLAKVRCRSNEDFLEVVGRGRIVPTDAGLVATRDVLEPVGLTSLRDALRRYESFWGGFPDVHITDEDERQIDDESQLDETSLVLRDGRILAQTFSAAPDAEPDEQIIRSLAKPVLEREKLSLKEVSVYKEKRGWAMWLTLEVPIRRRSVRDALRRADLVRGAIEGAYPDEFDVVSAAYVIRARHPELLIGTFESDWLEAKGAPYRLGHKDEQYELAKDVASFANANGGLLLIGAKTKRRPDGDEIQKVNGCLLADAVPTELRSVLAKRVYPRIEGLEIEQVPLASRDRGVVLIQIPKQPSGLKPFLVVGTKAGERVSELGITYPVREGEGAEAPRVESLHQLIRAGTAALAGANTAKEVAALREEVEHLKANAFPDWLVDTVEVAAKNGFHVVQEGDSISFTKKGMEPIVVQATAAAPPADRLQRQKLLEELAEEGLPVKRTPRGFLQPIQG